MLEYVFVNGKRLRRGYSTGSCAAAAARAAARMLFKGERTAGIEIDLPRGDTLVLQVDNLEAGPGYAECSVRKDGGDDPDATTGLEVFARVESAPPGIEIHGGPGVGTVTRPGLLIEVGQPAINPAPRRMIEHEVRKELPAGGGARVTISVPGGEPVAEKTFNPRLGIIGGISILGTTGIVEPMSEEGLKESLGLGLKMLAGEGEHRVVLVPGSYGEDFAIKRLGIPPRLVIEMSNFVGYMLDRCVEYGFREALLVGHLGKLVKVAGGIFHTHSRVADARLEIMTAAAALHGADADTLERVMGCATTEAVVDLIEERGIPGVYGYLADRVSERCRQRVGTGLKIGTIVYSQRRGLLAMDPSAREMLEGIKIH
ncbi:MAG: cobalamin biosynthesis protein CbiD [Firmicutes bacterium]|nr:cobalamin biosynthesis protein CbiD [Bacillota bacterium]